MTLRFDGQSLTLNDAALSFEGRIAEVKTDTWYVVRLEVNKSNETCWATVADNRGNTIGKSERLKWKESSKPDFFNIGFDNEATGTIDLAECEAMAPNAYAERYNTSVEKGEVYRVVVTYQGELTTGYVNSDLAGYVLGYHDSMATDTLEIACPRDVLDLRIGADKTGVAKIADVKLTKLERQKRKGKVKVHHIGDSTSAGDGSWARVLEKNMTRVRWPPFATSATGELAVVTWASTISKANWLRYYATFALATSSWWATMAPTV